ncbi:MAG: DUF4860 domain-containing protein [Oscillospiraceae bacterium]
MTGDKTPADLRKSAQGGSEYRVRSLADTASAMGSMLLFVLFAACMLMVVAVAADTYGRIKSGYQQTFGTVTSMKYITNKLRSADSVTIFEYGTAAAVECDGMVSVIYCEDDGLYEINTAADGLISAEGGDRIAGIDGMLITERDGMYEITVKSGGESSSVLVRKG